MSTGGDRHGGGGGKKGMPRPSTSGGRRGDRGRHRGEGSRSGGAQQAEGALIRGEGRGGQAGWGLGGESSHGDIL